MGMGLPILKVCAHNTLDIRYFITMHYSAIGMSQGMISPGLAPPGPSPLPQFGAAFGSWDSPPYSPNSYRQHPVTGKSTDKHVRVKIEKVGWFRYYSVQV